MPKYIAVYKLYDEENEKNATIEADDIDDAKTYLLEDSENRECSHGYGTFGYYGGLCYVKSCTLHEIKCTYEFNIAQLNKDFIEKAKQEKEAKDKEARRLQYEELKKEFG